MIRFTLGVWQRFRASGGGGTTTTTTAGGGIFDESFDATFE